MNRIQTLVDSYVQQQLTCRDKYNKQDVKQMTDKLNEQSGVLLQGHIKIHNPETGEVIVDKRNAIHSL